MLRLIVIGVLLASSPASGQSLGDIAKKTAEQRQQKQKDAGASDAPAVKTTFTNSDLKTDNQHPTVVGQPPEVTALQPIKVEQSEADRQKDYQAGAKKDETYWKNRRRDLQTALDTDEIHLVAMIARVDSLSADFNNSSSLSQRAVIRVEREAAATEVTRLKAAVLVDKRNIDTCEEEARHANVPAGWLRPSS
jgi:hypothetical protein